MDRSLQERLIGAGVLVALGVWLIPWVLDGSAPSRPEQSEQARLQLPVPEQAQRAPIRRETIELGGNSGAGLKTASETAERSGTGPSKQVGEPQRNADDAKGLPEPAAAPVAASAGPDASAADDPPAPLSATSRTPTEAARASGPEILAASPVAGWMVQLGSFSDEGNARRQAQRIGTYGHEARIYKFAAAGGRTMFRVRLGPVETREGAEAAASALSAQGFVAQLVAPE
jgi:DedD protein